jgi:hypothetical protein
MFDSAAHKWAGESWTLSTVAINISSLTGLRKECYLGMILVRRLF